MAKKKTEKQPALSDFWTEGRWRGMTNYECKKCPFAHPDKTEIERHVRSRHVPKPPRKAIEPSPLTDRFGNKILKETEVPDGATDED